MKMILFGFVACVLAIGTSANALTLKEKQKFQDWTKYLTDESQSYAKTAKDKCGYAIPVKLDEAMTAPFMEANAHAASYCDNVRSQIASMCEDATAKEAISKKVKSISCKFSKKADDLAFKLAGTTLEVTMGTGANNIEAKTKEFLENKL